MSLELTQNAKNLLATRGFDPVLGARPLRRTIQREIEDILAEKMLYGEVGPGQIVLVDVVGEGPTAEFTFKGQKMAELPDLPPLETVAVEPSAGPAGRGEGEDETPGPTDVEKTDRHRVARTRRPARTPHRQVAVAGPSPLRRPDHVGPDAVSHSPLPSGRMATQAGIARRAGRGGSSVILSMTTLKDRPANVEKWLRRNLAGGIDHMIVYLDGPQPEVEALLEAHPHVTAVHADAEWYADAPAVLLNDRQILNAGLTSRLLAGLPWAEWLFHVDGDEVAQIDRAALDAFPPETRAVRLGTLEAVGQLHPDGDPILFKRLQTRDELHLLPCSARSGSPATASTSAAIAWANPGCGRRSSWRSGSTT